MKLLKHLTTATFSKYHPLSLFVLISVVVFLVVLYFGKNLTAYQLSPNLSKMSVSRTQISPTHEIETIVKSEPAGAKIGILKKEVSADCGVHGLVYYTNSDNEDPGSMTVVSTNSEAPESARESWKEVEAYLNGKSYIPEDNIDLLEEGFHFYCSGYASNFIRDIPISYPQTDSARAFMSMVGQDPWGTIMVAVFAKKEDELILLRLHIKDRSLYQKFYIGCSNENSKCYREKVFNDPYLQELATRYANGLVETFRF